MASKSNFQANPTNPSPSDVTTKMNNSSSSSSDPAPSLSKFLCKVVVVVGGIIVVSLFPSRAPEFVSHTLFTRGWKPLHLLFVGIAVCYGLFSWRNAEEDDKDNKFENAQTYVSRFLQASSVFDVEVETLLGCGNDESRIQSWSSQYSRGEPVAVVAADESSGRGVMSSRGIRTRVGDDAKPLLLPVRSLKSRVLDSGVGEHLVDGDGLLRRSDSGFSRNLNERATKGVGRVEDSNVVLRSPIAWRSRFGRMEMKEEVEGFDLPKVDDDFPFRPVRSDQQKAASRSNSASYVPNSLSPRPSAHNHTVSPELRAKEDVEDGFRRKSVYNKSPPPGPPLPPPMHYKSPLMYSSHSRGDSRTGTESGMELRRMASDKVVRVSRTSEGMDSSRSAREEMTRRVNSSSERRSISNMDNGPLVGKSVRKTRPGDSRPGHQAAKDIQEVNNENNWKDVMEAPEDSIGWTLARIGQTSLRNERPNQEMNIPVAPLSNLSDPQKEENEVYEDIFTVESDSESESEEDLVSEALNSCRIDEPQPNSRMMPDFGPDVDKKADEFIAKFREQIRLQRIESIKRSTYQVTGKVT